MLHRLARSAESAETSRPGNLTRLGALVAAHLGVPAEANQLLSLPLPAHRLVDADLAKESARLTALQTKQQLGVQALSIANSSSSALLGLFR